MAKEGGMGIGEILLIGVGGYLLYNWYVNSQTAAPPVATTPVSSPPATTSAPPATTSTPPAVTPPAPPPTQAQQNTTWSIVGPVTTNVNNSLSANVNINGTITNVSIIFPAMTAWDVNGHNVTASLTQMGVNVPALGAAMLAAYKLANPSASTTGFSGVAWLNGAVPGLGQVRRPVTGRNYLRPGAPMRRIG